MKKQPYFPMLAVLFLILGCGGQVPSEPSADESTPLFAKATAFAGLHANCIECLLPGCPQCTQDGHDFYTDNQTAVFGYDVCPAETGTIQMYWCENDLGSLVCADYCNDGTYKWRREKDYKYKVKPGLCAPWTFAHPGSDDGHGAMFKYQPQGSGFYGETYSFTIYRSSGP